MRLAYTFRMIQIVDAAQALARARKSDQKLPQWPGPKPPDLEAAYRLQQAVTRELGWTQCGWKVGCTSTKAQELLRLNGPFSAPLFAERLFQSGAHVVRAESNSRLVEPEIAFVMRDALPERSSPYNTAEVLAAVATVHPALELVNPRLPHGLAEPIEWTVADGGINDGFVLGPGVSPLSSADYAAIQVNARQNDVLVTTGLGSNVLGGPERVLTWLANHLAASGRALGPGDLVTTGLLTELVICRPGDEVSAELSGVGTVSVRL